MNRNAFTLYAAVLGMFPVFVVVLFFLVALGSPFKGEPLQYLSTLPIAVFSAYLAAHIIFNFTDNMAKKSNSVWPFGILFSFITFVIFGLLITIIDGINRGDLSFARYSEYGGFVGFIIGWFFWAMAGFILTSVISIPLGIHLVNKYKRSNKKFNLDSGADTPPPVN